MASIPPGGEGDFVFLFIGGILLVMGLIGVVAPDRLVPRDIGVSSGTRRGSLGLIKEQGYAWVEPTVPLPKRAIEITSHAQQRAFHRLRLEKGERTHWIREALRRGDWYESPDARDEFLVVHRVGTKPVCLTVAAEDRQLTVTTVYKLRNPGKVRAYRQHGPQLDADDIADRYRIKR